MLPYLVDHTVPGESCIVHDDVDLAVTELRRLLDKLVDVVVAEHVTRHCQSATSILLDGFRNTLCLLYRIA